MATSERKRWSQRVTEESNALDLEQGVFSRDSPRSIARSLKRSLTTVSDARVIRFARQCPCLPFTSIAQERIFRKPGVRGWKPLRKSCATCIGKHHGRLTEMAGSLALRQCQSPSQIFKVHHCRPIATSVLVHPDVRMNF